MIYKSRILWVTNLPAPYRFRIWDELEKSNPLRVIFLLSQKNWRNWSISTNPKWQFNYLNYRHFRFKEIDLILGVRGVRKYVRESDFIILTAWEAPVYFYILFLAKKYKVPCAIFYESTQKSHNFNGRFINALRKMFFLNVDLIVTPGKSSTSAITDLNITNKKILTLFNPVDVLGISKYVASISRTIGKGHRYIFIGRFIELKNLHNLIRAFANISNHDDKMILVGTGKLESELIKLSISLGISAQIEFTGEKRNVELLDILARSHTLILPSTNEVWGMVVNEALACGLHVVVAENCGVCDLIQDHKGVYICKNDSNSIAEKMYESRREWNNWIPEPEILKYGPESFARELAERLLNFDNRASE